MNMTAASTLTVTLPSVTADTSLTATPMTATTSMVTETSATSMMLTDFSGNVTTTEAVTESTVTVTAVTEPSVTTSNETVSMATDISTSSMLNATVPTGTPEDFGLSGNETTNQTTPMSSTGIRDNNTQKCLLHYNFSHSPCHKLLIYHISNHMCTD